jgi:uncharacterized membrane protein YraQ (UPF0718 family)
VVYLWIITLLALLVSTIANRRKTLAALKIAVKRFSGILPVFAVMLILLAVVLSLVPDEVVLGLLGKNSGWRGVATAAVLGSVTLMPGFIAFPLCGALLAEGASYMVLSAFSTTLMTVGILTYPIERQYLGRNVTLVRNAVALAIAVIVAVATGFVFGELAL